jgi:hypothetical protein
MPRYSAPGAIRRCHTAAPVHRTGANLSPANMRCAPAPGREPPGAVLREQGCHSRSWQGGDRPLRRTWTGRRLVPSCRQRSWPSADGPRLRARSANRGDLRARHLHTAHARTGRGPRPARQTGPPATPRRRRRSRAAGPHAAADTYPLAHPRADSVRVARSWASRRRMSSRNSAASSARARSTAPDGEACSRILAA